MIFFKQTIPISNLKPKNNKYYEFVTRVWYDYDNEQVERCIIHSPLNSMKTKIFLFENNREISEDFIFPEENTNMFFSNELKYLFKKVKVRIEQPIDHYYSYPAFDIAKLNNYFDKSIHIGDIIILPILINNPDILKLDGQQILRKDYVDLWEFNQITKQFTYDNNSLTLPKISANEGGLLTGYSNISKIKQIIPNHGHTYNFQHRHFISLSHLHWVPNSDWSPLGVSSKGKGHWSFLTIAWVDNAVVHGGNVSIYQSNPNGTISFTGSDTWEPHGRSVYYYILARI